MDENGYMIGVAGTSRLRAVLRGQSHAILTTPPVRPIHSVLPVTVLTF